MRWKIRETKDRENIRRGYRNAHFHTIDESLEGRFTIFYVDYIPSRIIRTYIWSKINKQRITLNGVRATKRVFFAVIIFLFSNVIQNVQRLNQQIKNQKPIPYDRTMQLFVYISFKHHHLDDTYLTLSTIFLIACADDIPDADSLKSYFLRLWAFTERERQKLRRT